jgi:hypothetical protein
MLSIRGTVMVMEPTLKSKRSAQRPDETTAQG